MAESMWNDVKKLSDLLYHQTKEQKDILLLKLRMASYSSKRESAFARLGGLVYKPLKDGKNNIAEDKEINSALNELVQIEKDIKKTEKELDELRVKTADNRSELGEELGKTWEKTKTAVTAKTETGGASGASGAGGETKKTKSKTTAPGSAEEPEKKAKKPKAKSSSAQSAKDRKKGSKESDES